MNFPATGVVASDGDYLRLRALPGAASDVIGHLRNGAAVTLIARQPDAQGRAWYQVELGAVAPDLFADEALTRPVRLTMTGWCAGWLIRVGAEEEQPQPTPGDGPAGGEAPGEAPGVAPQPEGALPDIGINWLNGGPDATKAMAKGCPALQPSFNPGQARDLKKKYPGRHIVVRGWIEGGPPSISQWKQRTELDTLLPGTIVLGVNENDNGFHDGDPGSILDRARFDAAAWQECQARGLIYAGGGFAVGTPNIIDPAIAQAMRDGYAPLFNAGMWFNQHCYMARDGSGQNGQPGVPLRDRFSTAYPFTLHGRTFPIRQSWWTAERWRFYCAVCGFDPRRSAFISDEMGLEGAPEMVDAPTPGGFAANPQVDVIGYLKDFQRYSGLPAWFGEDGNAYPSPFKFGLVFCANGGERWAAYEVSGHVDAMAEALWSAARAPVAHAGVKRAAKKPKTKKPKAKGTKTKTKATKR